MCTYLSCHDEVILELPQYPCQYGLLTGGASTLLNREVGTRTSHSRICVHYLSRQQRLSRHYSRQPDDVAAGS